MQTMKAKNWELRSKAWLELNGQAIIGHGRVAMLKAIARNGSILHASQETGISYRKMRGAIHEMESLLGQPLVHIHRGGGGGGGAVLTDAARELLDCFERFSRDLQQAADANFKTIFR